jgi:hypothetical protein
MVDVEENGDRYRTYSHDPACQPSNAAKASKGRTEITVAVHILVAVAAQPFADNHHFFGFALRMQFVADIATTALTTKLVDEVRGARDGPLVRVDLRAAYVACLRLGQLHLPFRTRRVLLFGKMFLAEAITAIRAAAKCFLIAFAAAASGTESMSMLFFFVCVLHSGLCLP